LKHACAKALDARRAPILPGRNAQITGESSAELALVPKSAFQSNVAQGTVRSRQHASGTLKSTEARKFAWTTAKVTAKAARQMNRMDAEAVGNARNAEVLQVPVMKEFNRLVQPARRS
jgi:hypothetical protein